ncbi:MAG: hypothetical protein HC884_18460 [Chloroflexaceae bacterium]|nr:hypothetical protein [Chloroflexaceae bacterium]
MILGKNLKIERGIDTFIALRAVHEFVEAHHDHESITIPFRQGNDCLEVTVRQTDDQYLVTGVVAAAPTGSSNSSNSFTSAPSAGEPAESPASAPIPATESKTSPKSLPLSSPPSPPDPAISSPSSDEAGLLDVEERKEEDTADSNADDDENEPATSPGNGSGPAGRRQKTGRSRGRRSEGENQAEH